MLSFTLILQLVMLALQVKLILGISTGRSQVVH
jgi:hypothetical protein